MEADARVEDVFTAWRGSEPMERRESVEATEEGLEGDRYRRRTGHYTPYDVCAVTLVDADAIDRIREEHGIDLRDGRHRRNLVTRGIDVHDLLETTFTVGGATLRGTRPRPPCAHVEEVADEEGLARALSDGRGGICADVLDSGTIAVGDPLRVVEDDPRTEGRRIAERLAGDDARDGDDA